MKDSFSRPRVGKISRGTETFIPIFRRLSILLLTVNKQLAIGKYIIVFVYFHMILLGFFKILESGK